MSTTNAEPMTRCCPTHDDWQTLADHLSGDFGELTQLDVIRELARARQAVRIVTLDEPDELQVAELIARNHLMMNVGRVADVARLDPEVHQRRAMYAAL